MATINMLPPNPASFYERGVRAIARTERTAGDGSPGTTDTYTIYYTDATTSTFQVYNGADGLSAYEIAVANGFEGTEEEWLESLVGVDGEGGSVTTVQTITGANPVLSLVGGAIKTWTLTEDSSFTMDLSSGESLRLHVIPDGNTLTLPSLRWPVGGAPSLGLWDEIVIQLTAVGDFVYAELVGKYPIPEEPLEPGDLWNPSLLTPSFWLDGAMESSFTLDGNLVSEWRDRTGNGLHAEQSGVSRPEYVEDAINGLPAVQFGTDLIMAGMHGELQIAHVFIVTKWTAGGSSFPTFNGLFTGTTGSNDDVILIGNAFSTDLYASSSNFSVNAEDTPSAFPAILDPALIEYSNTPVTINNYQIGRDRDNSGRNWPGLVAEVLVFSEAPATPDVLKVQGYLAHKWGFANSLPEAHPYYEAPPLVTDLT